MRRVQVAGMMLLAWVALSLPAHAVVLRYSPKVGATVKHKVAISGRMETVVESMGQTMRVEMTGDMLYSEKALSETAQTARVETTLTGGKMTLKMDGESQSQNMPKGRMVADMDRRGRMVKLVESDFGELGGASGMMGPGAESWSTFSSFGAFPEGDVKVGDTWSDQMKLPATEDGPEISLKVTSRLLALVALEGRNCAKIRSHFQGPMTLDLGGEGMEGPSGRLWTGTSCGTTTMRTASM